MHSFIDGPVQPFKTFNILWAHIPLQYTKHSHFPDQNAYGSPLKRSPAAFPNVKEIVRDRRVWQDLVSNIAEESHL
ncbi:hypothetical protein NC652_011840 [Populus alba x Populus x berolinensis]|nr:hypothetical protein NC652_011840 [Populus alba x Populus x berolinensis]